MLCALHNGSCNHIGRVGGKGTKMNLRSSVTKWAPLKSPYVKYGLIALAGGLWTFGLVDQLYSSAGAMKYILMSLLIGVVAML